jgi:hypothetical protein
VITVAVHWYLRYGLSYRDVEELLAERGVEALALFTPEGERRWVGGWRPEYLSGATDEVGAVWHTSIGGDTTTWVTTDRDDDRVRYARISSNGTAGLVEVLCSPAENGASVRVIYDLTACTAAGVNALHRFAADFDDMLEHWRQATTSAWRVRRSPAGQKIMLATGKEPCRFRAVSTLQTAVL